MYRQGDVWLIPITLSMREIRVTKRRRGEGLILAVGEATGHHHKVEDTAARLGRAKGEVEAGGKKLKNPRVLAVSKRGAKLVHEEHSTIDLPAGKYAVVGQREYDPPAPAERKPKTTQGPLTQSQSSFPSDYTRPVYD